MAAPRFCFACGTALPAGARFCPQCGQSLASAGSGRATEPGRDTSVPGERRQVAVMFADLAGYTELASTLDPEEVHRLLGRFFDAVDGVVTAHGGTIDKHIGDAVMAVFGAPVAHDNDAERATHAACEVHRAVAALAAQTGHGLAAHIGIACGEVVAAGTGSAEHSEYTVTGDAVNLAARLDGLAKAGETLVSADVWRAVSHRFAGEGAGRVAVKGFVTPVETWRVLRAAESPADEPALAGRRNELSQLTATLVGMRDTRTGRLVVVRGEAGIGKTRLAAELLRLAQQEGVVCHRALVLDFGVARGRGAVAAIAAQLLGAPMAADEQARENVLLQGLRNADVDAADEAFVRDLFELPLPAALRAGYEALDAVTRTRARLATLRNLAEHAARRRPRLVVIEDAHWADVPTLESITALARACASAPQMLLITTRIDGDPFDARWRTGAGALPSSTIDLAPLADDDALEIAKSLAPADDDVVRRCVARADGNPLFLVQLLRNASESAAIPASIQSLVLARIDRLDARDRAALQAAAVIGQRFPLEALRHVANEPDYRCDALIDHHLVRPEDDEYLFAHALICDGAYASLLHSRKRILHGRAAAWYAGRDSPLRALHLDRAGDAGAATAYVEAARDLAHALRFDEAVALAERAVAIATDSAQRYDARMFAGTLLRDAGRTRDSIRIFEEAVAIAPDAAARCRALIGVAAGRRLVGETEHALAALSEAGPLAEASGLVRERATIHHTRGNLYFARGEVPACLREHELSLEAAREAHDLDAEANALSGLGDARYAQGRMRSAFVHFSDCVALARKRGLARTEAANLCMSGHSRTFLQEWDAAVRDVEAALDLARGLRQPHAEMFALESLAVLRLGRGEYDEARAVTSAALDLARRVGARRYEAILLFVEGELLLARGDRAGALERLDAAQAIVKELRLEGFLGPPLQACIARASDDRASALAALAEGEAQLARGAVGHCHFWYRRDAIDATLARGELDAALRHCDALESYTRDEPLPWAEFQITRGRTSVAWRRDRTSASRDALRELRDLAQRCKLGAAATAIDRELDG